MTKVKMKKTETRKKASSKTDIIRLEVWSSRRRRSTHSIK